MAKRQPKVYHPSVFYDKCAICVHESRNLIEKLYLNWKPVKELANAFELDYVALDGHLKALGFPSKRIKNTDALKERIISLATEELKPGDVPVAEAVKLIKHEDVVEGKVVHRVKQERPEVVFIGRAIPAPGAQIEGTAEVPALEAASDED